MTTTIKNGQISRPASMKKGGSKQRINKPNKGAKINNLNSILEEIVQIKGWKNIKVACKNLGIPTNGAKVTSKQLPGYIGMAMGELKKLKK